MAKKSKRKKQQSRPVKTAQRYGYESAANTRLNSDWVTSAATADFLIHGATDQLRNRARDLDRNNDYVVSAVNKFVTKTLGEKCPVFQSRIKKARSGGDRLDLNTPLNQRIEAEFHKWMADKKSCSANQSWDLNRVLDLCVRTLVVDGEVFIRRCRMARGRSPVKLCLELIEADSLAHTYQGDRHGNPVVNGIEYDEWGAPIAYYFYSHNPNDFIFGCSQNFSSVFAEPIRYPADEIIHLYSPRRLSQGRGVSFLSATISRLRDLVGYEQAVLVGARMRAAVMGFIHSPESEDTWGIENPLNGTAPRQYSFEPGTIQKLGEGEEFSLSAPQDPGPNLESFGRYQLRAFAANLGISTSSLSGDYSQANYSSERANQIDERRGIRRIQDLIKSDVLNPITDWWLDMAVMQGIIKVPPSLETRDYYCCYEWRLGGFEWVDPQKDAAAYELQLKNGMTTLTRVLGEKNIDLHTLIEERQHEQELLAQAGIKLAYLQDLEPDAEPEPEQPDEDAIALKEGMTQIRSIVEAQGEQISQLSTVLLEASRAIGMANNAIAEIRGLTSLQPITIVNESPKAIEPASRDIEPEIEPTSPIVGFRKAKNCKKGKPCGGSCQSKKNVCLVDLSPDQKALALKARKAMASSGGVASELPEQNSGGNIAPEDLAKMETYADILYDEEWVDKFKEKAQSGDWREWVSVAIYAESEFEKINTGLRSGQLDDDSDRIVRLATSALDKGEKYEGLAYRGTDLPDEIRAKYTVGGTIEELGFTSSSYVESAAFKGNTQFIIQSKTGVKIDDISPSPSEKEVLFKPKTKFTVTNIDGDKIYLEEN